MLLALIMGRKRPIGNLWEHKYREQMGNFVSSKRGGERFQDWNNENEDNSWELMGTNGELRLLREREGFRVSTFDRLCRFVTSDGNGSRAAWEKFVTRGTSISLEHIRTKRGTNPQNMHIVNDSCSGAMIPRIVVNGVLPRTK